MSLRELVERGSSSSDVAALTRALEAGKQGDLAGCLGHELSGRYTLESPHRHMLQDLLDQGEDAPAWAYSRWCLDLAAQSMLLNKDPQFDKAVQLVVLSMHPARVDDLIECRDALGLRVFATQVAASDPLARDIALFELGGLRAFLEGEAQPGLLARTDDLRRWADTAVRAYSFKDFRGCRLVLQDLVTEEEIEVLNIGARSGAIDEWLVGRVVPISAEPGWMFAQRPLAVDEHTARGVAAEVRIGESLGWCRALGAAVEEGRLAEGFHCGTTPFTSDLLIPDLVDDNDDNDDASWAYDTSDRPGAATHLTQMQARDRSAEVANALAVLRVSLVGAGISDRAAAVAAPHAAAALQTRGAFEAARTECTGPETADAWWILAGVVPEHLAGRCRVLARRAESRRSRTDPA